MDYEKKYNEALAWMRELYPGLHGATKEDAEHYFPELRESEDERIRKEMIAYFAHRADVTEFIDEGEDCKRWISYLEKQKEQKLIDYPYLPGWRKNRDNNKPELKRSVLMLTTHGVAEGEWLGEKWCQYRWSCELKDGEVLYWIHLSDLERLEKEGEEKQKEQKQKCPTYLDLASNEFEACMLRYLQSAANRKDDAMIMIDTKGYAAQLMEIAKKEQKPALSEVELLFRGEKVTVKRPFYRDDKGRGYSTAELDEDVAWNALRAWCEKKGISLYDLYPKAEWSEEDAVILNCCISSIEEAKENRYAYKETDGDTSYDREIAWLKSLRPSWKPSEEQMNRLVSIVAALRKDYCDDMADFLASLYNQLKKL